MSPRYFRIDEKVSLRSIKRFGKSESLSIGLDPSYNQSPSYFRQKVSKVKLGVWTLIEESVFDKYEGVMCYVILIALDDPLL